MQFSLRLLKCMKSVSKKKKWLMLFNLTTLERFSVRSFGSKLFKSKFRTHKSTSQRWKWHDMTRCGLSSHSHFFSKSISDCIYTCDKKINVPIRMSNTTYGNLWTTYSADIDKVQLHVFSTNLWKSSGGSNATITIIINIPALIISNRSSHWWRLRWRQPSARKLPLYSN